jgi:hypothetical protein
MYQNLGFTAVYNVAGIALTALGLLPPVWAAAAQSLPDVAVMLNSSRLLRGPARQVPALPTPAGAGDGCGDGCPCCGPSEPIGPPG